MTWLITGGAGYIGAHVVELAKSSGRDLVVLDDLSSGISSRLRSDIELVETTLLDSASVNRVFKDRKFSNIIHIDS